MGEGSVIWGCPRCDHWEWGTLHEAPDCCPECYEPGSSMALDREAALEALGCIAFHKSHERSLAPWPLNTL